ncbi:hypothetical protein C943_03001 [Mariniradius saccharolyticus AK6]|uniref:Uncharacterized protein n=1 Tax=Mariniradius saccharolyticus AK6 TaxID=1239962 RepID=M7XKR0_9BACT|nr:hypothetical protein C943_03001 [Mariniradius saccharolyticus AK6]
MISVDYPYHPDRGLIQHLSGLGFLKAIVFPESSGLYPG